MDGRIGGYGRKSDRRVQPASDVEVQAMTMVLTVYRAFDRANCGELQVHAHSESAMCAARREIRSPLPTRSTTVILDGGARQRSR